MTLSESISAEFILDPMHESFDLFNDDFAINIWKEKYAQPGEKNILDTFKRVAKAIARGDARLEQSFYAAMSKGLWMPGGRILAGAGTAKRVTLMNCYVSNTIDDNMEAIMEAHKEAALTMQQGGGIGMDFSTVRPRNAVLNRTGSKASGPLHFMDMWNAMCLAIRSAGDRRGAMMGVLSDTHPDLPDFIKAKREAGRLTQFNVSILVTDKFMKAVKDDSMWFLHFKEKPFERDAELEKMDWIDENGDKQYVYSAYKACELWDLILKNTYEWAEPGIIFIDRINDINNLKYCETIRATNPCGEQPLPPYGTCNLGAINLSRLVLDPFTDRAEINWKMLYELSELGVYFLDNVIEETLYPLPKQEEEERNKRRLGLGISGLADCLAQLKLEYGSKKSIEITEAIQKQITYAAYKASNKLAKLKNPFPLYNADAMLGNPVFDPRNFITNKFEPGFIEMLRLGGLRNGVLLTIAPTGTTTIVYGNGSSGCEPVFAHTQQRNVRQDDNTYKPHIVTTAGARFYLHCAGKDVSEAAALQEDGTYKLYEFPKYMVTANDLSVENHIEIQAALQKWIDASISKTVNCPADMTYEDFVNVYTLAYESGCKGCTTYRPSDVRGSILAEVKTKKDEKIIETPEARPQQLSGTTYKIKWPSMNASMYITINDREGKPYEMFFSSKDARHSDWMTALTLMISSILRSNIDPAYIPAELKQITSLNDIAWIDGKFYASPVAYIAHIIELHLNKKDLAPPTTTLASTKGLTCPACSAPAMIVKEGCKSCTNCNYSQCG